MDVDFTEKLKNILSDPDAMAKITAIASGLNASAAADGKGADDPARPEAEPSAQETQAAFSQSDTLPAPTQRFSAVNDPRLTLLNSLKPLLREEKRDRVDALTRALSLASMMKNFRK